jgi:hypothetical protein
MNSGPTHGMSDWRPVAVLANLCVKDALESGVVALTSRHEEFSAINSRFDEVLSRFTDAFGKVLEPAVLMVRLLPRP